MSKEINFNSIEEFMLELNKKAKEDNGFKKLCLERPREAIAKIAKMEIPDSIQFSFNEIGEELFLKMDGEGEISDDELDNVAGGDSWHCGQGSKMVYCPKCDLRYEVYFRSFNESAEKAPCPKCKTPN